VVLALYNLYIHKHSVVLALYNLYIHKHSVVLALYNLYIHKHSVVLALCLSVGQVINLSVDQSVDQKIN